MEEAELLHQKFMRMAILLSKKNLNKTLGGPFGAVIVKDGKVIAKSYNRVAATNDPTAHAEVVAIRQASKKLQHFDLSDCTLYTSCEPCPMCLGAIYWAGISKIYYANTKHDAEDIGFADKFIYDELELPIEKRRLKTTQLLREEAIEVFKEWHKSDIKAAY